MRYGFVMETNQAPSFHGLHHVTAVTADAQKNLDYYTKDLGMRLVKRTVNQDDVSAYHLFYADELGSAGTDMTFFEWPRVPKAQPGAGTVAETGLRVLGGVASLEKWVEWFRQRGINHGAIEEKNGFPSLTFRDEEGQRLRLIAEETSATEVHPWKSSPVPASASIVGLGSVTLSVRDLAGTADFLTQVLGFRANEKDAHLFETGPGGVGARLHLEGALHRGFEGAGGVHHVAWRVKKPEDLLAWQTQNSFWNPVRDRHGWPGLHLGW
jgi:glyoxalase family protein